MEKVYLIKKGNLVIAHMDLAAMKQLDGIAKPTKTVTVQEWEAAGSKAYIDGSGNIVLGISPEEQQNQVKVQRRIEISSALDDIDVKSVRSARAVATALANAQEPNTADVQWLNQLETRAAGLRGELASL